MNDENQIFFVNLTVLSGEACKDYLLK